MSKSWVVKLSIFLGALCVITLASVYIIFRSVSANLPQIINVKDYEPLLVSQVFDRNDKKVGEFFLERRTLIPYEKIPKNLINAFLAAEDDQFFHHGGLNYQAILRAFIANMKAGHTVQGGSTITQQVAKTFFLSDEKKLLRKLREALLAFELEKNLSKEDILYLYLNQIYFGNSAYGIENAAQTYFRKPTGQLNLGEMAILAGLPKAPTENSPVVNPVRAKERQVYVLRRMAEVGFIPKEEAEAAIQQQVKVYVRESYETVAPHYLETIRQLLVQKLGEEAVLKKGIRIYASLDAEKQKAAQDAVVKGLKDLDKRQGFRGPLRTITDQKQIEEYFTKYRRKLVLETTPERTINPDGNFAEIELAKTPVVQKAKPKTSNLPSYLKLRETYEGVVTQVDDQIGLVYVSLPETQGVIDFESIRWARTPNPEKRFDLDQISKPSQALKVGDVIHVRIVGEKPSFSKDPAAAKPVKGKPSKSVLGPDLAGYLHLELDQEPLAEAALLSFDQQTQDIVALVGGYSFSRNKLIRAFQAFRQTGSAFKSIVYASALDKGFTPSTTIMDAPVVFEEANNKNNLKEDEEGQDGDTKSWKPSNHGRGFGGEIIFRNALVASLNIPAVKVVEDLGVNWPVEYARRLGVFSPLNMDFSLVLGSSSLSLYEMTKIFSQFGRLGKRIRPLLIRKVVDKSGKILLENLSLDDRFLEQTRATELAFEERRKAYLESLKPPEHPTETAAPPPEVAKIDPKKEKVDKYIFFEDPEQLMRPQTAYVMTTLLKGVVEDPGGTGGRARSLGREVAGKTGTTNNYVDAWFLGYTAQMATGVWVGFDKEKSLGRGEVGGRAALPIWLDFMKIAHQELPQLTIPTPEGIVFANIDSLTGKLASASSKNTIRQAYIEGTEPTSSSNQSEEATEFLKRDLSE
ncbi:MAG: PBP1A family penicillin-binding protein [Bdellovibrionales bacterium]|nr:PBP1A family penicillin-binding protein [Bdellovibrionales bacterium]